MEAVPQLKFINNKSGILHTSILSDEFPSREHVTESSAGVEGHRLFGDFRHFRFTLLPQALKPASLVD